MTRRFRVAALGRAGVLLVSIVLLIFVQSPLASADLSQDDIEALLRNYPGWVAGDNMTCSSGAGVNVGPTNASGHTLPAATGGTGFEDPISADGRIINHDGSLGGYVTFSKTLQQTSDVKNLPDPNNPSIKVSMKDLYRDYYITMRWNYVEWRWDGSSTSTGPEDKAFYAKAPRVLVTNPTTKRSIIAVVLESGPAPWTGVISPPSSVPPSQWGAYARAHTPDYWAKPIAGTPPGYRGRVSGFPPKAISALGATQRTGGGTDQPKGDDLIYSWAPDQNAAPGPYTGVGAASGATVSGDCDSIAGAAIDGYAFPLAPQTHIDYNSVPCNRPAYVGPYSWTSKSGEVWGTANIKTCHWDNSPALDLMYGPNRGTEKQAVYAFTDGKIINTQTDYHGVQGCSTLQFLSSKDNHYYWYGHMMNLRVSSGATVHAGQQIAQVALYDFGNACRGSRDHLHFDKGCEDKAGVPQHGGNERCRDPRLQAFINKLWESLPR